MVSRQLLNAIVQKIYSFPEFHGCIIGLYGDNGCSVLEAGYTPSVNYGRVAVIIEEVVTDDPSTAANTQMWADTPGSSPAGSPNPIVVTNRSVWGREAVGAGLSCGMTIVSAVGVLGGVAAEVPSAGTSTFLVIVAWTGMITSGIQCINGLVRVGAIIANPDDNTLQRWDGNKIYSTTILIVDALGMVAAIAALPTGIENLWAIIVRQRAFALRGLTEATLRNMNAAERAKVIRELIEAASKTPEGRAAIMAAAREADIAASTLARPSSLSVRNAT